MKKVIAESKKSQASKNLGYLFFNNETPCLFNRRILIMDYRVLNVK